MTAQTHAKTVGQKRAKIDAIYPLSKCTLFPFEKSEVEDLHGIQRYPGHTCQTFGGTRFDKLTRKSGCGQASSNQNCMRSGCLPLFSKTPEAI